jgi:thiol-disulfide isomerase/thioredoxin
MTSLQRRYLRSAIGVACGLVVGVAIIGILKHPEIDSLFGRSTGGQVGPVTAAGFSTGPGGEAAVMSLHDAPREVPELQFQDAAGLPLTLVNFQGKVVLLNIWATWCGPCRREMPTLDRLQATLGGPDFEVVALSIDRAGISAVAKFYEEVGVKHLAEYIDESGKAMQQLSAVGLPTTLLIDRKGREIARHVGSAEWDAPEMVTFLRKQLSREAGVPSPGATRKWAGERTDRPVFSPIQPQMRVSRALIFQLLEKSHPMQPQREHYHDHNSID